MSIQWCRWKTCGRYCVPLICLSPRRFGSACKPSILYLKKLNMSIKYTIWVINFVFNTNFHAISKHIYSFYLHNIYYIPKCAKGRKGKLEILYVCKFISYSCYKCEVGSEIFCAAAYSSSIVSSMRLSFGSVARCIKCSSAASHPCATFYLTSVVFWRVCSSSSKRSSLLFLISKKYYFS